MTKRYRPIKRYRRHGSLCRCISLASSPMFTIGDEVVINGHSATITSIEFNPGFDGGEFERLRDRLMKRLNDLYGVPVHLLKARRP